MHKNEIVKLYIIYEVYIPDLTFLIKYSTFVM